MEAVDGTKGSLLVEVIIEFIRRTDSAIVLILHTEKPMVGVQHAAVVFIPHVEPALMVELMV
ncbi:hypothetical protein, partial [Campylobacter fetus]|uniref:hypothetical protein n=1 Tax=Campylobacter fetus TaxID=196 RepID=UPI001F1ED615